MVQGKVSEGVFEKFEVSKSECQSSTALPVKLPESEM